jgi:hypothetical protein
MSKKKKKGMSDAERCENLVGLIDVMSNQIIQLRKAQWGFSIFYWTAFAASIGFSIPYVRAFLKLKQVADNALWVVLVISVIIIAIHMSIILLIDMEITKRNSKLFELHLEVEHLLNLRKDPVDPEQAMIGMLYPVMVTAGLLFFGWIIIFLK